MRKDLLKSHRSSMYLYMCTWGCDLSLASHCHICDVQAVCSHLLRVQAACRGCDGYVICPLCLYRDLVNHFWQSHTATYMTQFQQCPTSSHFRSGTPKRVVTYAKGPIFNIGLISELPALARSISVLANGTRTHTHKVQAEALSKSHAKS